MRHAQVQPQHVTPEVQAWVRAQAALGHTAPTILKALRSAGWLAHWKEQMAANRIFRPTQIYTGEPARDYIPLSKRN